MASHQLRILPLGGLGEIGMNCLVLEWKEEMVLIDCGIQFPDSSYAGVDLLLPDFSYVRDRLDNLRGIVVTHGHDDHIGAIPFLARERELDIYCTPFPEGLLRHKLSETSDALPVEFHRIVPRKKFSVGPFTFDPIPVQHSIIEALGFGIETPVGNLVHTGDFKHDSMEINGEVITLKPFEEWGERGVLLLMSDSTNAERAGHTVSENDIGESFEQLLKGQTGRIIIALFASNIRRVERLLWIAHSQGKKVALAGRSMHSYTRLAHEQQSLNIPENTLILLENIQTYPDNQVIVLSTGSQAEPQSALVRIAQGIHKDYQVKNGDMVILSSRFIPGNEKAISAMIDHLYRQGAEVLYESIYQIHVSGHGFQDELMMMLHAAKPRFFVPIHGEYRHLAKHAKLAKQAGVGADDVKVIEDGQILELTNHSMTLGDKIPLQKTPIVENEFMKSEPATFTQRTNLSRTGIVFVTVLRDSRKRKLIAEPVVSTYGLLFREDIDADAATKEIQEMVDDLCHEEGKRDDLEELVRLEVRRFFRKRASHKPVVIPLLLDL